jgi:ribosome-binding protein aMBF1 (putative translation factor)
MSFSSNFDSNNSNQYETVVLRKQKPSLKTSVKSNNVLPSSSSSISTVTKPKVNNNISYKTFKTLDNNETDVADMKKALPTISKTLAHKIAAARNSKGLTQKQLANKLYHSEKKVIKDIEAGTIILNQTVLNQINKVLETNFKKDD